MRPQKVFTLMLCVVFFLCLHYFLRAWASGSGYEFVICNPGGPFGISFSRAILVTVGCGVILFFIVAWRKEVFSSNIWSWILIISGGLGNVLERISFGCIMDYIALPLFPTFNLADVLLTVGTLCIVYRWGEEKVKNRVS